MREITVSVVGLLATATLVLAGQPRRSGSDDGALCAALVDVRNLSITTARLRWTFDSTVQYCYVKGTISPAIRYHVQLPLPDAWNGRFVQRGDGGKDGDLDFFDDRLAQGYVVANSNTG